MFPCRDAKCSIPLLSDRMDTRIRLLSCSPLGRGMLTGTLTMESLADDDIRRRMPRFQGENAQKARRPLSQPSLCDLVLGKNARCTLRLQNRNAREARRLHPHPLLRDRPDMNCTLHATLPAQEHADARGPFLQPIILYPLEGYSLAYSNFRMSSVCGHCVVSVVT